MSNYYMRPSPPPSTDSADNAEQASPADYARAMSGFVLFLLIYFCLLACFWVKGEATTTEVGENIIKKKVLPHGQSRRFDDASEDVRIPSADPSQRQCCLHRKKSTIIPVAETANEVLMKYKLKNLVPSIAKSQEKKYNSNGELGKGCRKDNNDSLGDVGELALAEEGNLCNNTENLCPICITPYEIGEDVSWSKLQYCRHVFHYECIVPWAVLGNFDCPVCRETFWSRRIKSKCCGDSPKCVGFVQTQAERIFFPEKKPLDSKVRSRFCVIHGLVSPSDGEC